MNWGINQELEDNTLREREERGGNREEGERMGREEAQEVRWVSGGNLRSTTRGTDRDREPTGGERRDREGAQEREESRAEGEREIEGNLEHDKSERPDPQYPPISNL